ncbi:MAG: hypothetical protein U5O39_08490 [Gammaproteobacteria bacterium]|nr:hypothetical protein [Gammaproteobacteria bacterium]
MSRKRSFEAGVRTTVDRNITDAERANRFGSTEGELLDTGQGFFTALCVHPYDEVEKTFILGQPVIETEALQQVG